MWLAEQLRWWAAECDRTNFGCQARGALLEAAEALEKSAPVVRCKDCKHYFHYGRTSLLVEGKNVKAGWCQRRIKYDEEHRMLADDFCSYGERKDGDG